MCHNSQTATTDMPHGNRVGTKRYMSPETLASVRPFSFETAKHGDIYAFGLVMWEITRRCVLDGIVEDYRLPYYDKVPSDPSLDDMKKVVCDERYRPCISNRWAQTEVWLMMTPSLPLEIATEILVHHSLTRKRHNLQSFVRDHGNVVGIWSVM